MGVFLQTALFPGCDESIAREAVETAAKNPVFQIDPKTCRYAQSYEGTQVLMEGDCLGFATLAKTLSDLSENPVMLLYIYDGDFWGYDFYGGKEEDHFRTRPDAFGPVSPREKQRLSGNPAALSGWLPTWDTGMMRRYLVHWSDLDEEELEETAYPDDQFPYGDCWQMTDFILVHILSLNNLLCPVPVQKSKQLVQAICVARADGGRKGTARQRMSNICLQSALCHIDHAGVRVPDKMDGAPGADPLILSTGGQRQIFRPLLVRRVVFISDGMIQSDLQAVKTAIHAALGDQDARCARIELDGPFPIVVHVEAWNALYAAALLNQALGQCPAHSGRRSAFEAKAVDFPVRQSPRRSQMFPMRRR